MKSIFQTVIVSCSFLLNMAAANSALLVQNGNNAGVGSLRAALDSGATKITIPRSVGSIFITEPLIYTSKKPLTMTGNGQTIDATGLRGDADILSLLSGADLSISRVNFIGNAPPYTVDAKRKNIDKAGKGIYVHVPKSSNGIVRITLDNISLSGVFGHGVHVSDCNSDDCGNGNLGAGDGSLASIHLQLDNVVIKDVGFGKQDADGVRVDERGSGDIYFVANKSRFLQIGADGIELDEGNDGDVIAHVSGSVFDRNGEYCATIPFTENGPCDDDGEVDLDDGFDIDESGDGSLSVRIQDTEVTGNFDEGLDFDEAGEGNLLMQLDDVLARNNLDEGIKASEEDGGTLIASLRHVASENNNGDEEGVQLEEEGVGNADISVFSSIFIGGNSEALKVEQQGDGDGRFTMSHSSIEAVDLSGVFQP